MSTANKLPETCHVYLDLEQLPNSEDGGSMPVPLSPFTIEWGTTEPWAETVPNVLKITLIDQNGRYARTGDTLLGHRITVTPDWTNNLPGPVNFCMFDGFITDTQILTAETGHNRISVTASDRLYILRTDCRKGPNWNRDENYAAGFQWWPSGTIVSQMAAWLANDGINSHWYPWRTYLAPIDASERASLLSWIESTKTRKINGKYMFEIDRMLFIGYQSKDAAKVPSFEAFYLRWDIETVLTGPRVRAGDDNTDIGLDWRYADAGYILVDPKPQLSGANTYYTQLELRYSHLKATTSSPLRKYEVTHDGSLIKQIETEKRNGETCLSIEANWADSGEDSSIGVVDTTRAEAVLKTQNRRTLLPEVTFRSDRLNQMWFYCRPRIAMIIGSRFERTTPSTHGPWAIIGGTLTYDATGRKGHWTHKVRLFPAVDASSGGALTCADMKALKSAATFNEANWKLGALRYVTKTGDEPA